MLKLLIEDDEGKQTVVPLIRDEITIGRKEGNTIRLTERNVSRRHARVLKVNGGVYVEDVASRYGTKLNGTRISSREKINPGDEVLIGDYKLSVQDESKKASDSTQIREAVKEPEGPQPIPVREQARLVVISSNFAGQEFPIARTEMVIGRDPKCDIIIDHRSISGTHAKIVRGANKVFKIVDLKSANGIKVNGAPFSVKELNSGEMIELGHVRFRFCAPGELWSFQLAAGLVEDLSPPPGRSPMIALAAILVLLVVAVAAFFLLQGTDGEGEAGATVTSTGTPEPATRKVDLPPDFDDVGVAQLVLECSSHGDKGEFDLAVAKCKQALDMKPGDPLIQEKYDRMVAEKANKDRYLDIKDMIEQGDCEIAFIDLDSFTDSNSWAARQILKEKLREKVQGCIEDDARKVVKDALAERDWETAEDKIRGLEQLLKDSPLPAQLRADLEAARKRKDDSGDSGSSRRGDRKVVDDKSDKTDKVDSGETKKADSGGSDCMAEAEAAADEAKSILIGNPSKAGKLLKDALKCKNNAKWRGLYAFSLERQGKNCDALKEYKKAIGGLSGREADRAQRSIDKFTPECK